MMKSIYYLLPLLLVGFALTASAQTDRDHIRHGNRLLRDSMFTDAQVKYQKAIEVDNTNAIAHYNLGYTLMMQGKAEDAMKEYEQAARLEKNKHRLSQIYHNMGVISLALQKYDQAVACYRQALRNDPSQDDTRYNYALSLYLLKKNQGGQDQQNQQEDENGQDEKNKKDQQQQQKQDQKNEEKDQQKEQPDPNKMSRENAEQMLNAAMQDEKNTQDKVHQAQQQPQQKRLRKQW